jgi:hypothetical protein
MELLFNFLRTIEFRPRLSTSGLRENRFSKTSVASSAPCSWLSPATANVAANVSS